MNKQILKSTLIAAAGLLFANSAMAATDTDTFLVTATVANSCLVSATDLNFGAYDPAAVKDGTSTITVTCTAQTPYTIGLDAGQHFATTRAMIGDDTATTLLKYELYTELGHGTIWGELLSGTTVANSSLAGGALDYTVYGQIPASQYVPAANYADTINVTVDY
ncbi:MAG: spore coat protein U domain-containing protein [Gammaproteobacteria bacterium]|nr:spore coat protein U domain-containing protein [Gammaproteobacteria bacterium]